MNTKTKKVPKHILVLEKGKHLLEYSNVSSELVTSHILLRDLPVTCLSY